MTKPTHPKLTIFQLSEIDVQAEKTQWEPRSNFRLANWNKLTKILKQNLANIPPSTEIGLTKEFDTKLKALNDTIRDTCQTHQDKPVCKEVVDHGTH